MITKTQKIQGKFSTYLAITSFGIGTLFLILHLLFESFYVIFCGYFYVLVAIVVNFITLLYLFYLLIFSRFDKETVIIRILILLSNIPIALLYLNIVLNNHLFN